MSVALPNELLSLLRGGAVAIVGTRDGAMTPELSRAWGLDVGEGRDEIELCVYARSGCRTLANIADNGQIAVTITSPSTYRSFQVKGRVVSTCAVSATDLERVSKHQQAFVDEVAAVGLPRDSAVRLFAADIEADPEMRKIRVTVDLLFDQTPGPGAGSRL